MLEKDIERTVCDFAKKHGCLTYKFIPCTRQCTG